MTACVKCGHDPAAVVTYRAGFRLDKRLETANRYIVNAGATRWRYALLRDEWCLLVRAARLAGKIDRARPSSLRRITITRQYTGRCQEIDRDNLYAGAKPLVDALVRESILHDDKAARCELHVRQERGEGNLTIVQVEELA